MDLKKIAEFIEANKSEHYSRNKEFEYTKVFMDIESNKRMLLGETVRGSLEKHDNDDMEITVGNYHIDSLEYPFVLVKSASEIINN